MKRIVEYLMPKDEFFMLTERLIGTGYTAHGYFGMEHWTIGKSQQSSLDACRRTSVFHFRNGGRSANVRVNDPASVAFADAHLSGARH